MTSSWYDATVIAAVNTKAALLNSGSLKIYTGARPALNGSLTGTLLASLSFGSPAFNNAVAASGTVTALATSITAGTAVANGTAGYFALVRSDGVTVVLTGDVGTSGSDLNFTNLSITSGMTVSCTGFSISDPQTGT